MAYYEWDPALETGDETIDSQHKSLFELANALQLSIAHNLADDDAIADAVYGLAGYVVEHFHDEEALMRQSGYPGLGPHRAQHEALTAEVLDFSARYMNGTEFAPERLAALVATWLTGHMMKYDMDAVAFIKYEQLAHSQRRTG